MKIGIVVDSSSGITKKEAIKRGWHFLPLYITIDGKEYADGIDIEPKQYYAKFNINQKTSTSASSIGEIEKLYEKIAPEYDFIVVFSISKYLSAQNENLKLAAQKYKNIYVVNSMSLGHVIIRHLERIEEVASKTEDPQVIIDEVEYLTKHDFGFAVPCSLKWLARGGRISPSIASLANLLKIVPIISFRNGKLDKYGKGRVFTKTIINAAKKFKKDIGDQKGEFYFYQTKIEEFDDLKQKVAKILGVENITTKYSPPVISNHTGPAFICIFFKTKKE